LVEQEQTIPNIIQGWCKYHTLTR